MNLACEAVGKNVNLKYTFDWMKNVENYFYFIFNSHPIRLFAHNSVRNYFLPVF